MGTLVCRVELHKRNGIIITVDNKDDAVKQTMIFDGQTITTTNAGQSQTSVITQKPESITIKCKEFYLDAETISCKSTKETVHESGKKFDIKTGDDFSLNSKSKITAGAATDLSMTANTVDVKAKTGSAKFSGLSVEIKASESMKCEGSDLSLKGTGNAELSGGLLKVSGKTTEVSSNITTTIGGPMIKIG